MGPMVAAPPGMLRTTMVGFPGKYVGRNLLYTRTTISVLPPGAYGVTIVIVWPAKETGAALCDDVGLSIGLGVGDIVADGDAGGVAMGAIDDVGPELVGGTDEAHARGSVRVRQRRPGNSQNLLIKKHLLRTLYGSRNCLS